MSAPEYFSIRFADGKLVFLDQTKLPQTVEYVSTVSVGRITEAIERLEIRGAPLIGVAAAYALALSQRDGYDSPAFHSAYTLLLSARPTAVNLRWGLDEIRKVFLSLQEGRDTFPLLIARAREIQEEDEQLCDRIAAFGLTVFKKPSTVLTHCNTGKLAVAGGGTALHVIRRAYEQGMVRHVFADETRPLLQGLRLTTFELSAAGIPFSVITDNMAAFTIKTKGVDIVITGADRIVRNGDSANKIGTYGLAVLCRYHSIPFYIAAPYTTIDSTMADGTAIPIEERDAREITGIEFQGLKFPEYPAYNPAFDVTPAELISGIITDKGLFRFPYDFS